MQFMAVSDEKMKFMNVLGILSSKPYVSMGTVSWQLYYNSTSSPPH